MRRCEIRVWKPFSRWTEVRGDRAEHQIHSDFELAADEMMTLVIGKHNRGRVFELGTEMEFVREIPPPGKTYRIHLKIALEEFDDDDSESLAYQADYS